MNATSGSAIVAVLLQLLPNWIRNTILHSLALLMFYSGTVYAPLYNVRLMNQWLSPVSDTIYHAIVSLPLWGSLLYLLVRPIYLLLTADTEQNRSRYSGLGTVLFLLLLVTTITLNLKYNTIPLSTEEIAYREVISGQQDLGQGFEYDYMGMGSYILYVNRDVIKPSFFSADYAYSRGLITDTERYDINKVYNVLREERDDGRHDSTQLNLMMETYSLLLQEISIRYRREHNLNPSTYLVGWE